MQSARVRTIQAVTFLLCLAAAVISYKLLAKHVTGSSGSAWFDAGCRAASEEAGGADCQAVLESPYSYFPPKREGEPPGRPHTPVALYGLLYYSALGIWVAGIGRPSRRWRWIHLIPLLLAAAGLIASIQLTRIMFTELEAWCPWCLATHILNALIAVGLVLLWPWKPPVQPVEPVEGEAETPADERTERTSAGPSVWRVLATLAVIALAVYGHRGQYGAMVAKQTGALLQRCIAQVKTLRQDPKQLMRFWASSPQQEILIRPDDPFKTRAARDEPVLDVVVYSDFQCPMCARFARFFEGEAQKLFGGRLKLIYKHYPLDAECNPLVMRTVHAGACEASRLAEAARILGGREAFWKVHDELFRLQRAGHRGRTYDVEALAALIGVKPETLRVTMDLPEVRKRVEEDIRLAQTYGVHATPTIFIEGRRIHPLATTSAAFWDALADAFWKRIGAPRPPETKPENWNPLGKNAATPGTPGPKDAP